MEDLNAIKVIAEVAKEQSKEIYQDGFKGSIQEVGQSLQTVVGLFNNVVLYPLKKANISYKYKLEQFEKDLIRRMNEIPSENIIEPPLNIVGSVIESLKYTFDTNELREMYMNLLTSSMDISKIQYAHPSYVDIIRQMTPLEAKILKKIVSEGRGIECSKITFNFEDKYFSKAMPKIFSPTLKIEDISPFLISSSIENLCRLGLIRHSTTSWITNFNYEDLKKDPYVVEVFNLLKSNNPDKDINIKVTKECISMNDFGENFSNACL